MAHTIDVDHRRTVQHPPYQTERTPPGRVTSAYEPSPSAHHALAQDLHDAIEGEALRRRHPRGLFDRCLELSPGADHHPAQR